LLLHVRHNFRAEDRLHFVGENQENEVVSIFHESRCILLRNQDK
jgi:hypothetical protein